MAEFNPDAYLAQKSFDPDAYLKSKPSVSDSSLVGIAAGLGSGAGNVALGAQHYLGKGLGAIGAETVGKWLVDDAAKGRENLKKEIAPYKQVSPYAAGGGELAGEIISTLPVGGLLGAGAKAVGANTLANALRTGGMTTGADLQGAKWLGAKGVDMATRTAGGAATGAASASLVDPNEALTGGIVGGAMPGTFKALGAAGSGIGQYVKSALTPEQVKMAEKLAAATGETVESFKQKIIESMGKANAVYDKKSTLAQLLQNPTISTIENATRNASPLYVEPIFKNHAKMQVQNRLAQLEGVAPVGNNIGEAGKNAGDLIADYHGAAKSQFKQNAARDYGAIDPFNEARINLPVNELRAAHSDVISDGTSQSIRGVPDNLLAMAEKLGIKEVEPPKVGRLKREIPIDHKADDLAAAVRAAGGIKGVDGLLGGEMAGLSPRQTKTTGLINNKNGKKIEDVAQVMYDKGFIRTNDPADLLEALTGTIGGNKNKVISNEMTDTQIRKTLGINDDVDAATLARWARMDREKPVSQPLRVVDDYRRSLSEGISRESTPTQAKVLQGMKSEIDKKMERLAAGEVGSGEFFTSDMQQALQKARDNYQQGKIKLDTGAQSRLSAKGQDGLPVYQGQKAADLFYNGGAKSAENMSDFKRLIQGSSDADALAAALKSYATTKAAGTATKDGLSANAFSKWMDKHGGANERLFSPSDMNVLNAIRGDLKAAQSASDLGIRGGQSATISNNNAIAELLGNGLLDSPMARRAAGFVPKVGSVVNIAMDAAAKSGKEGKANKLAELLVSPQFTLDQLSKADMSVLESVGFKRIGKAVKELDPNSKVNKFLEAASYRAAPIAASQ